MKNTMQALPPAPATIFQDIKTVVVFGGLHSRMANHSTVRGPKKYASLTFFLGEVRQADTGQGMDRRNSRVEEGVTTLPHSISIFELTRIVLIVKKVVQESLRRFQKKACKKMRFLILLAFLVVGCCSAGLPSFLTDLPVSAGNESTETLILLCLCCPYDHLNTLC